MGSDLDLLEQAAREGLIRINGVVTFRHPLIRSTVYRSASPQERRAAHAALAAVLDEDLGGGHGIARRPLRRKTMLLL